MRAVVEYTSSEAPHADFPQTDTQNYIFARLAYTYRLPETFWIQLKRHGIVEESCLAAREPENRGHNSSRAIHASPKEAGNSMPSPQ